MPTCALVAACDFNAEHFALLGARGAFDCVVAVDAGYASLREVGCVPDKVIGDFDSLGYVPKGENVEVYPSHKDASDLELAFEWALEHGFAAARVYGALGGRLDHSLANLQIAARVAEAGVDVVFVGADAMVKLLVGPGAYRLPCGGRGTVSVFSAVDESRGVSEEGLEYPLAGAVLSNRTTLGLSNELVGRPATVTVDQGTLYIFHPLAV